MMKWGFYRLAFVAVAGLTAIVLLAFITGLMTFNSAKKNADIATPALVQHAPAPLLEGRQYQELMKTLTQLSQQQIELVKNVNSLEKKLQQLEALGSEQKSHSATVINESSQISYLEQIMDNFANRLAYLELELSTDNDDEPLDEDIQLSEQHQDISMAQGNIFLALDDAFNAELRSDAWAEQHEAEISARLLSDDRIQGGQLFDFECRSTICRLDMQFGSEQERDQSLETLPAFLDFDSTVSVVPLEGTTAVLVYVSENSLADLME